MFVLSREVKGAFTKTVERYWCRDMYVNKYVHSNQTDLLRFELWSDTKQPQTKTKCSLWPHASTLLLKASNVSKIVRFDPQKRKCLFLISIRNPPGLAHISSAAYRAKPGRFSSSLAPSRSRCRFPLSANSCPSTRSAPMPPCAERSPKTRSLQGEDRRGVYAEVHFTSLNSRWSSVGLVCFASVPSSLE